ncbi:MAG: HEAT repeat domain-containing protein [Bradymonadales bacterium]|nr:HEAT repeat domain-containing protein [Bradymonadales bacterium]
MGKKKKENSDLQRLSQLPPWDWPDDMAELVLAMLRDTQADPLERLLAAEMAGTPSVINDQLLVELNNVLCRGSEEDELRCMAGISIGMGLEALAASDEEEEEEPISMETIEQLQRSLHSLYLDRSTPDDVRRAALEASVRMPEDWHTQAVQEAHASSDPTWRLTSLFCMGYIPGFEAQIIEALDSTDPDLHYEAVCAAGNFSLPEAWPHVSELAVNTSTEKNLRVAAITAMAAIRPEESLETLNRLTEDDDEEIAEIAEEAMEMAREIIESEDEEP